MPSDAPLIVHVIHRLDVGGMENGLVNLINHMPAEKYRHAIVSLTESTSFRERIRRDDVECYSLHKKSGQDFGLYVRLWRLLRGLRPVIVHTRNLAAVEAVEAVVPAALAGVPCRVHGEHGRDLQDVDGTKRRYRLLRSFDVFALSSRMEGISNTVLEAMASGLPVVATRVGGNDELVEDGKTGCLVPSRSPEALATALLQYVSHPELIHEHGRAGRRRAEHGFDIPGMVARYTEVYDDVMARCGRERPNQVSERSTTPCAG